MNYNKTILITAIINFFICSEILGQHHFSCGTKNLDSNNKAVLCSSLSWDYINHYKNKENYIPRIINNNSIIKTLHINFNIWQRHDGTGNLINTPETYVRLKRIGDWINNKYQYISPPVIPVPYSTEYLNNSTIQ